MNVFPIVEADFDPKSPFVDRLVEVGCEHGISDAIEFGCGQGKEAALLAMRTGWSVLATDGSPEMLDRVPAALPRAVLNVSEPLPKGLEARFQLAYCAFLVHLLTSTHRRSFFANCFRCLDPEGVFVCLTASADDLRRRFLASYFPTALQIDLNRYGSVDDNLATLRDVGFGEVTAEEISLGTVTIDLDFYRRKLSSIVRLIPPEEYAEGLRQMERYVAGCSSAPRREWRRTLLIARKRRL